ncbi:MAG: hypothetical protein AABY22_08295 [Nanoarchaeota archaeon]
METIVKIIQHECLTCHVLFWISEAHHNRLVSSKEGFYCPNGHCASFVGKTDVEKLKEVKEELNKNLEYTKNLEKTAEASYKREQELEKKLKECKKAQKSTTHSKKAGHN